MMNTHWSDRLSEYLDGHLDADERIEAEAHLAACEECWGVLEDLKWIAERAGAMEDRGPERDLWPSIAAGLAERGEEGARVLELSVHREARRGERMASVRLSWPQLAAAGLVLMMASAGGAWMLRPDGRASSSLTPGAPSVMRTVVRDGQPASPYAEEVQQLEAALADLGNVLAPSTARIIQKNLIIIDQAIEESMRALENDPNDAFLKTYLDQAFRQKVEYLRETAAIVGAI